MYLPTKVIRYKEMPTIKIHATLLFMSNLRVFSFHDQNEEKSNRILSILFRIDVKWKNKMLSIAPAHAQIISVQQKTAHFMYVVIFTDTMSGGAAHL